jgi:hypothetical protein
MATNSSTAPTHNRRHNSGKYRAEKSAPENKSKLAPDTVGEKTDKPSGPYASQLAMLRELFSATWNDDDLVAVLTELGGDLETTIARISEGRSAAYMPVFLTH